ncbi:MAG TPA: glycerophosphodiester phosphodiesterase [Acidimicrobiales bacterium]|nr:glycerophosphodiester phosphodiesterase [Acidimicrobiales bacterium]
MVAIIAHRGAAAPWVAGARENTVEAFAAAVRMGADGVEFDVRRTGDGALVVHHDAVLPGVGPLANLAVAQLPEWLPLFDAAIESCDGLSLHVEIKDLPTEPSWDPTEAIAAEVAAVLVERGLRERALVSSFSLATIDAVHSADPAIPTAWLTLADYDQHEALATVAERGHVGLNPRHEAVTRELVRDAHALGVALVAWTVDDPERLRELASWGVDAVITNDVEGAQRALRGRTGPGRPTRT